MSPAPRPGRNAVAHLQAGGIATALALAAALLVPAPWGRIAAVTFLVVALVFLLVAPTERT